MCNIPLQSFWITQLRDTFTLADEPPRWFAWAGPSASDWARRIPVQLQPEECRRAASAIRGQIFIENTKGMILIAGMVVASVALLVTASVVAGLVFEVTRLLFGSTLFSPPLIGPIFQAVVYGIEGVNLMLGTIVIIGKLSSKILLPPALQNWTHAEELGAELPGFDAGARRRVPA